MFEEGKGEAERIVDNEAYADYRHAIEAARSFDRWMEDLSGARTPTQTGPPQAGDQTPAGSHDRAYVEDDPEFLAIFARTLVEVGNRASIREALLYRARLCSCPCHETVVNMKRLWKLGDPADCPTKFCTHGGRLCAAEMNAHLNHHGSGGGVAVVGGTSGSPTCCGETVLIGTGRASGFHIEVWRCLSCGWHKSTAVRVDGQMFWTGGRAIGNKELKIIADSYAAPLAADPLT